MQMKKQLLVVWMGLCFLSCKNLFHYSPDEVRLEENEKNLNQKNIEKIISQPVSDSFRFVVMGDSQRFYEEMDDFVSQVNRLPDISFVLLNGDISDFGQDREFKWINERLSRLKVPYIAVIGNHDMLANGRLVYHEMFGPENFSFNYSGSKFICLNSNSRECGFDGSLPNIPWLQSQLAEASQYKNVFVFSHVPPFNEDFDQNLVNAYTRSLSAVSNVRLSIHGHLHSYQFSIPYHDGIGYLVTTSMNNRSYAIVSVQNENAYVEQVNY